MVVRNALNLLCRTGNKSYSYSILSFCLLTARLSWNTPSSPVWHFAYSRRGDSDDRVSGACKEDERAMSDEGQCMPSGLARGLVHVHFLKVRCFRSAIELKMRHAQDQLN